MSFEDQEVITLVKSYESSLKDGRLPYFDVEDLETIVNYYLDTGSYEKMKVSLTDALEVHPHSLVFKVKEIQLFIALKDFRQAQIKLHLLEGLADQHVEVLIAQATVMLHKGDKEKALALLDNALDIADDPVEILQQIVDAHLSQGEYGYAAAALERLCDLEDDLDDTSLYQLALCLDFTHDFEKGIGIFNRLIEKEPYNALLWYQKGTFWLRKNNEAKAIEAFNWATTADDTFHAAYFELGRIHEEKDRLIDALTAYRLSISEDVPSGYVHFRIGMIEQELGSLNEALREFNIAIEIEPDLDDVFLERANVLHALDRHMEAIEDYKRVWLDESFTVEDVIDYVECLIETEQLNKAIMILHNAISRFEGSVQLKLVLAGYLFATDEYLEASQLLGESLKIDPSAVVLFQEYFPELISNKEITSILVLLQTN